MIRLAAEQKTIIKDQFTELSKQLDTLRENENFYEKDIEDLKKKCIHLKKLLNPVDINITTTDISPSLAQAVTLRQTEEKPVETPSFVETLSFMENPVKYNKLYKQIKIPHTGVVHMANGFALLRSGDNITMIDLNTDSLQSICVENSWCLISC